jgi:hypothetical protein
VDTSAAALDPSGRLVSDLWIDQPDAREVLARRRLAGERAAPEAMALDSLVRLGYCLLRPEFSAGLLDELVADVDALWREQPPDVAYARQGLLTRFSGADAAARLPGCRIADLHTWSQAARSLYLDATLARFVELAFGEPAIATQSLFFEWGSQQPLHRDPMHVQMTRPAHLLAAWIALEDISEESGPLLYIPGSHRLPYYQFAPGQFVHDDRRDGVAGLRCAEAWDRARCAEAGLSAERFLAKKGDVLLWHHSLLHGGSLPVDPPPTRKSFVVHYSTQRSMRVVTNSYLDPYASAPGAPPERRVYTTDRILRAPGAVGFDSPLHACFESEARAMLKRGGLQLSHRVAAMEASRFWKARNAWFALKRQLGPTTEP